MLREETKNITTIVPIVEELLLHINPPFFCSKLHTEIKTPKIFNTRFVLRVSCVDGHFLSAYTLHMLSTLNTDRISLSSSFKVT